MGSAEVVSVSIATVSAAVRRAMRSVSASASRIAR